MEVIRDELQKNGIRIDITTLSNHINEILDRYKDVYKDVTNRLNPEQLADVFHEMSINTVGRVMAYLTLVYSMNLSKEEDVRKAARLTVPALRNIIRVDKITDLKNVARPQQSFIRTLCSSIGYTPMGIEYYIMWGNF